MQNEERGIGERTQRNGCTGKKTLHRNHHNTKCSFQDYIHPPFLLVVFPIAHSVRCSLIGEVRDTSEDVRDAVVGTDNPERFVQIPDVNAGTSVHGPLEAVVDPAIQGIHVGAALVVAVSELPSCPSSSIIEDSAPVPGVLRMDNLQRPVDEPYVHRVLGCGDNVPVCCHDPLNGVLDLGVGGTGLRHNVTRLNGERRHDATHTDGR